MTQPTLEQLAKLPKWALSRLNELEGQRDAAVRTLNEFQDSQTHSQFYFEDHVCLGEQAGPSNKRKFVQTHTIIVEWRGVLLRVSANDYGNSGAGIRLQWESIDQRNRDVCMIPTSWNSIRLVSKKDML